MMSFKNPYCWGPTCWRIPGSISCIVFDSGCPTTDSRFSRIENITAHHKRRVKMSEAGGWNGTISQVTILTSGSSEVDHRVIVFEHVHFFYVIQRLHAYSRKQSKHSVSLARQNQQKIWLTKLLDSCLESFVFGDSILLSGWVVFLLHSSLGTCTTSSKLRVEWTSQEQEKTKSSAWQANVMILFTVDDVPLPPSWTFPNLAASLALASATSLSILF